MKRILAVILTLLASVAPAMTQTPTEEQRLAEMVREAASECAARLPGGNVRLTMFPGDTHPMVYQLFAEELAGSGRGVSAGADFAGIRLDVDVRGMESYTVSHGNSSYLRTVSVSLGVLAGENRADSVLFSKEFNLARTDTLSGEPAYDRLDLRERNEESWTDAVLTPVIATAVAVIIVVLLFTVRGS